MAKGKNSAALFEVIRRNRPAPRRRSLASRLSSWLPRWRSRPVRPAAETAASPEAPPAPIVEPEEDELSPAQNSLQLDSDRQEVNLRLSYTAAIICIVALITVVAAAFLAGRKTTAQANATAQSPTSDELRRRPPQPGVVTPALTVRFDGPGAQEIDNVIPPAELGADSARASQRSPELNYVVIQSYPEKEMAEEAVKQLRAGGIEATIERGLAGWGTPNWYSVVGVTGFKTLSNSPQYEAYTRKIRSISEDHAKKGSFKAFDPRAYKWSKQR